MMDNSTKHLPIYGWEGDFLSANHTCLIKNIREESYKLV